MTPSLGKRLGYIRTIPWDARSSCGPARSALSKQVPPRGRANRFPWLSRPPSRTSSTRGSRRTSRMGSDRFRALKAAHRCVRHAADRMWKELGGRIVRTEKRCGVFPTRPDLVFFRFVAFLCLSRFTSRFLRWRLLTPLYVNCGSRNRLHIQLSTGRAFHEKITCTIGASLERARLFRISGCPTFRPIP